MQSFYMHYVISINYIKLCAFYTLFSRYCNNVLMGKSYKPFNNL